MNRYVSKYTSFFSFSFLFYAYNKLFFTYLVNFVMRLVINFFPCPSYTDSI